MADQTVELDIGLTGRTLTMALQAYEADDPTAGSPYALTELTEDPGRYVTTLTAAETGSFNVRVNSGSAVLARGHLKLDGVAGTYRVRGEPIEEAPELGSVWDSVQNDHLLPGSTGEALSQAAGLVDKGAVAVDHNYGGTDALRIRNATTGAGIADATVAIYTAADYDAGRRGQQFVLALTRTDNDGRWLVPLRLDPGDYSLVVSERGFKAKASPLAVAAP